MSPEHSQPTPHNPGSTDPTLQAGNRQHVKEDIRALATDPDSLSEAERGAALVEAKRLAGGGEKVIVTDKDGQPRWGKEYSEGKPFTFDGIIRGHFEEVPKNVDDWTGNMQLENLWGGGMEGRYDHAIIETDDGNQILIRRTNDRTSASKQTFELISTSREAGRAGQAIEPVPIDTEMLKGVVLLPGEQMMLGVGPDGKRIRSRGAITKITAFGMGDKAEHNVAPNHPHLTKRPEMQRDTLQRFNETLKAARKGNAAPSLGRAAAQLGINMSTSGEIEPPATIPAETETAPSEALSDDELIQYLEDHNIDVQAATERYEQQVRAYTKGLHEKARVEGRDLTDGEKDLVRNALETLREQQKVAARLAGK